MLAEPAFWFECDDTGGRSTVGTDDVGSLRDISCICTMYQCYIVFSFFLRMLVSGWTPGVPSHRLCLGSTWSSQAQDDFIEVLLNSAWVTGILGDPVYVSVHDLWRKD